MNTSAKPNTSKSNHTGVWRDKRPQVVPDKCLGCQLCAKLCPDACIVMGKDKKSGHIVAKTDYRYCKGCGLCAKECPARAITMEKEG